jgi:hypothetical protein
MRKILTAGLLLSVIVVSPVLAGTAGGKGRPGKRIVR